MGAILNRPMPIAIEYDCRGQRATTDFANAIAARRFYAAKLKEGKNPKVKPLAAPGRNFFGTPSRQIASDPQNLERNAQTSTCNAH